MNLRRTAPCAACAVILSALMLAAVPNARGEVKLSPMFGDHMVLQQGMPVPVWGTAAEGEKVSVSIQGQKAETTAKDGQWMVRCWAIHVPSPLRSLSISSDDRLAS